MFVKITKCSEDTFWYKDKIGEVFKVETAFGNSHYIIYEHGGYSAKCISVEDCEIVSNEDIISKKYGIEYRNPGTIVHNATIQ